MKNDERDRLLEIGRALTERSCVGDAVTDRALFAFAAELRTIAGGDDEASCAAPDVLPHGEGTLSLPREWSRVGSSDRPVFTLHAASPDAAYTFDAVATFAPLFGFWRVLVALNGCTVFLAESEERDDVLKRARDAICRAWALRGPVR